MGNEAGAYPRSPRRSQQALVVLAVTHHGRDPRRARHLGGCDLAPHAARAERRGPIADLVPFQLLEGPNLLDQLRACVHTRIGGVEPGGVGQQDEQARLEQDRDLGREEVVVAERDLVGRRVSFSLMTGTARQSSSRRSVWRAFR